MAHEKSQTFIKSLMNELQKDDRILIYGAYGYSGELICELLQKYEANPQNFVVAGRSKAKLDELVTNHKLKNDRVVFAVNEQNKIDKIIKKHKIKTVLNCAGPFKHTAEPMIEACIRNSAHYLDITGEYEIFEHVHANQNLAERARKVSVCLIPGVGFDVVPSDCLAKNLGDAFYQKYGAVAKQLNMGFIGKGPARLSHGTQKTMFESWATGQGSATRLDGHIVEVPFGAFTKSIPFYPEQPKKRVPSMAIPWGDISTAYHSTRIPNIQIYLGGVAPSSFQKWCMNNWMINIMIHMFFSLPGMLSFGKKMIEWTTPKGPTNEARKNTTQYFWGEAVGTTPTQRVTMRLLVSEGYTLTAETALASALMCTLGKARGTGSLTPSQAFGKEYISNFDKSKFVIPSRL